MRARLSMGPGFPRTSFFLAVFALQMAETLVGWGEQRIE